MYSLDLHDIMTVQRQGIQQGVLMSRRDVAILIDLYVPPVSEVTIDSGVPRREWRRIPATP